MQKGELAEIIRKNFVVVKIDCTRDENTDIPKNLEIEKEYKVQIGEGMPAVVILDAKGRLLCTQHEFAYALIKHLNYDAYLEFFKKWAPKG